MFSSASNPQLRVTAEAGNGSVTIIATPGHKGFYVSWQSASQQVAVMFAASIGVVLNGALSAE